MKPAQDQYGLQHEREQLPLARRGFPMVIVRVMSVVPSRYCPPVSSSRMPRLRTASPLPGLG